MPQHEPPQQPNVKSVLAVLVGMPLGGTVLGVGITMVVLWASADLRDATHRFLDALRDRDDGAAYAMLTRSLQARVPEAGFSSYVDRQAPHLRQSTSEWINGFGSSDSRYCVDVWLKPDWGGSVYVLAVKEDGVWRVDEITEDEPDECADGD